MTHLAQLRIRNYRCFSDHTIQFGPTTIVVGKNNAGKSTLIETLRLASLALRRFRSVASAPAPEWLDDHAIGRGQRLDLSRLGLWANTLFHRYGDPPAQIETRFSDGSQLTLYIGPEGEAHAVIYKPDGLAVRQSRDIQGWALPKIGILPQITPLEREERILVQEYVLNNLDTHLASRHFRNQLNALWDQHFVDFREIVEATWPGIRVEALEGQGRGQGALLELMIRDGGFVAEAGWMGHGLQMWLQTLWFIVRARGQGTIVLDEPDVYMHPDLQRRLIRILKSTTNLIVATHSTEILSEVDASQVLVLDRDLPRSSFATDLPAVQRVVEGMGSAQNLQIARLWKTKSLLLVEGEDMKVLKRIHDLTARSGAAPLDTMPNWSIGGWNGWANAIGSVEALKNAVDQRIRCYCLFDADYHLDAEKEERYARASQLGIELHILEMKEIENYLVVPGLLARIIELRFAPQGKKSKPPSQEDVAKKISELVEEMIPEALDCYADELYRSDRAAGIATANKRARELILAKRASTRGPLGVVSGKELISRLSSWSKQEFGVSFGLSTLLRALRNDEVDSEIANLVSKVDLNRPLR